MQAIMTKDFEHVGDDAVLTVVDFWAAWCGPCKMQTPVLEDLDQDYAGQVKFASLDVDQNQELAQSLGIMSIPSLVIFKNGKPTEKVVGFHPKAALKKYLDSKLAEATAE
ncbi:thioredoxin [Levilactobacillus namurensis]|uniref:thioredoxin n=1 Tax=Levilactobacillus namurensis TaxID=380393 RepID=UPI0026EAF669|nr:thioredoxin [Levilactobacillus namurensis]